MTIVEYWKGKMRKRRRRNKGMGNDESSILVTCGRRCEGDVQIAKTPGWPLRPMCTSVPRWQLPQPRHGRNAPGTRLPGTCSSSSTLTAHLVSSIESKSIPAVDIPSQRPAYPWWTADFEQPHESSASALQPASASRTGAPLSTLPATPFNSLETALKLGP